eukprot:TRINITY_DN590_c0_g1_i1.p1 TRINITY_DN590_c0_g1~~TRINITY_DN590_c0_g1_i1.p1  ORF type:complete len:149 (-),score=34.97 TRINITY_DN590_c0_g1_i1:94-519(-)
MPSTSGKSGGKARGATAVPSQRPAPQRVSRPPVPKAESSGKKKKKRQESWSLYIFKVLKQVHHDLAISQKAMNIMNSFISDIFERLNVECSKLAKINKTKTLSSREVQTSVRLLIPGELAKHAMSEGTKAIAKYGAALADA